MINAKFSSSASCVAHDQRSKKAAAGLAAHHAQRRAAAEESESGPSAPATYIGDGPSVVVSFVHNKKIVVTAPAQLVKKTTAYERGAITTHKTSSGSHRLDEVDFKNAPLKFRRGDIPTRVSPKALATIPRIEARDGQLRCVRCPNPGSVTAEAQVSNPGQGKARRR